MICKDECDSSESRKNSWDIREAEMDLELLMGNQHRNLSKRGTFIDYNSATLLGDGIVRPPGKPWGTTDHIGNLDYIKSFGTQGDIVLLVKFNPRDAVSVPADHNASKLRVCRYEVLSVYEGEIELGAKTELEFPLYRSDGDEYDECDNNCEDCDGCEDDSCDYDDNDYEEYDPCEDCSRDGCLGCRLA